MTTPSEQDAHHIIENCFGEQPVRVERFATGLCHYVYDVTTTEGNQYVVRMAKPETRNYLLGSLYWQDRLEILEVPIPKVLCSETETANPYTVIERISGTDLGRVYSSLTSSQKRRIAKNVVLAQKRVGKLPKASGFGHAYSYEDSRLQDCSKWHDVIHESLARSRLRIEKVGAVDAKHVDRIFPHLTQYEDYFSQIEPRPFLPDTSTKNVIVFEGSLAGIVDIDEVCFGDPLFAIGLTQMALLGLGYDLDYVRSWYDEMSLDDWHRSVVTVYASIFCVCFMSELGQDFNKQVPIDADRIQHYESILDGLLGDGSSR